MRFRRSIAALALLAVASLPVLAAVCETKCDPKRSAAPKAAPHCPMHPGAGQALANARDCSDHGSPVADVEARRTPGQLTLIEAPETFSMPARYVSVSRRNTPLFSDTSPPLPPGIQPLRI
jgi:hypothetical protein